MLRIGPNLRSCGGKSLPRTHAATNREFDDDACYRAALWLPLWGLEGGPFVPISADYGETHAAALWLPYRGLEGGLLSRYLRIMATHGRPLAPILGLEGGLLSRTSADYGDAWPPSGSHIGG